jgi:hypothetical protein
MSPARRFLHSLRGGRPGSWLSLLVLGLAIAVGSFELHRRSGYERTDDAFVEGTFSRLAAQIEGRIVEILVDEHERVAAGQVLVRLDPAEAHAHLDRALADLSAAENRIVAAEASASSSEAAAKAASIELWRAGRELERIEQLAAQSAASEQQSAMRLPGKPRSCRRRRPCARPSSSSHTLRSGRPSTPWSGDAVRMSETSSASASLSWHCDVGSRAGSSRTSRRRSCGVCGSGPP